MSFDTMQSLSNTPRMRVGTAVLGMITSLAFGCEGVEEQTREDVDVPSEADEAEASGAQAQQVGSDAYCKAQAVLDRHCTACHDGIMGAYEPRPGGWPAFACQSAQL